MRTLAYCERSGVIHFAPEGCLPPGMLPIASGDDEHIRHLISARSRMAHDNETMLVPGIPEAGDDGEGAVDALIAFSNEIAAELNHVAMRVLAKATP